MNNQSSSSDSSIYAALAAAARRGAAARGPPVTDLGSSSNEMSSSLGSTPLPDVIFFGTGAFVFPDALRAVVLDAGLAAALDAAGFFSKKSAMEAWAVGFVFLAGFMYA